MSNHSLNGDDRRRSEHAVRSSAAEPPTEADLIEIENLVLKTWQIADGNGPYRIVQTLEYLIARARYHNQRQAGRRALPASTERR
jgi:hypothetical protein